jgi:hypothetical protein
VCQGKEVTRDKAVHQDKGVTRDKAVYQDKKVTRDKAVHQDKLQQEAPQNNLSRLHQA